MRIAIVSLVLMVASNSWALDYPKEAQGAWISIDNNQKNACENPQLVIEQKQRYDEVDVMCKPSKVTAKKVSNTITNYIVIERCEREDSKWVQTSTFEPGGLMLLTEKRKQDTTVTRLKLCR